jgi:hypothetical protein
MLNPADGRECACSAANKPVLDYGSLCEHCSVLKLSITDFIPVDSGEGSNSEDGSPVGDWNIREAQLG